jgi:hypothetical protein
MSRTPRVFVDKKAVDAAEVQAIVARTTLYQIDTAEITMARPAEAPLPTYRIGAHLDVEFSPGDAIFAGRIVSVVPAPQAGFRRWIIRGHGPMRAASPAMANDVRIAEPITRVAVRAHPPRETAHHASTRMFAEITLGAEFDSIKFVLGQTKQVSAERLSFTGIIVDIERRYGQSGGSGQVTLGVEGLLPKPSPR